MRPLTRIVATVSGLVLLGVAAPARAASPMGNEGCDGVRPGAAVEAPSGITTTMGFVLKGVKGKDKAVYVTTIGNYEQVSPGTKTWGPGKGPVVKDGNAKKIGRFVYAYHRETPPSGTDFATFGLIRLDKKVKVKASVCHFGGPTGVNAARDVTPTTVEYYGQGFPTNQFARARTGIAQGLGDPEGVLVAGLVDHQFDLGDIGAPVLTSDGRALGIFDGAVGAGGSGVGFNVARLPPKLALAQRALKIKFTLQTASPA